MTYAIQPRTDDENKTYFHVYKGGLGVAVFRYEEDAEAFVALKNECPL